MQALQAQDTEKIAKLTEERFAAKLLANQEASAGKEWFDFQRAEYDIEKVTCVDKLLIKGVGVDRSTNEDQMDYSKISNLEQDGLRQYIHKFDLGMQDYYYTNRFENEIAKLVQPNYREEEPQEYYKLERTVRDGWHQMKTEMFAKQFRYLLRVTLQIKDNGIGEVTSKIVNERAQRDLSEHEEYPNEGNHIAIFECQVKQLPMMTLATLSHKEFLFDGRLNFRNWKLVDVDNYMGGNKHTTENDTEYPQEKY